MLTLYERIQNAVVLLCHSDNSYQHQQGRADAEAILWDLQQRLEDEHRQAREPTRLWACVNTTDGAPACWVGTWDAEECPRCGSGMYMVQVNAEMDKPDRVAVWTALCQGKLQLPRFGDEDV